MAAKKGRTASRGPARRPAPATRAGIRVGVVGWGTIGSGVIRFLRESNEHLSSRLGAPIELARVADLDLKRKRAVRVPKSLLTKDARSILTDPKIDVVVELMGGLEPARTFVLEAIRHGKDVVTANKALLAHHGAEIFAAAEEVGVGVGFEASVGGGRFPPPSVVRSAHSEDVHAHPNDLGRGGELVHADRPTAPLGVRFALPSRRCSSATLSCRLSQVPCALRKPGTKPMDLTPLHEKCPPCHRAH